MHFPCPQATFDVQFDGTVADKLDASAQTTAFRQVLFAHSFGGAAAQHLVNVTAHLEGTNRWLDLDYITFTAGKCVSSISSRADAVSVYLRRPMLMRSPPSLLSPSAAQRPRRHSGPPPPRPHGFRGTYPFPSLAIHFLSQFSPAPLTPFLSPRHPCSHFSDGDSPAGACVNRGDMGTARCGTRAHGLPQPVRSCPRLNALPSCSVHRDEDIRVPLHTSPVLFPVLPDVAHGPRACRRTSLLLMSVPRSSENLRGTSATPGARAFPIGSEAVSLSAVSTRLTYYILPLQLIQREFDRALRILNVRPIPPPKTTPRGADTEICLFSLFPSRRPSSSSSSSMESNSFGGDPSVARSPARGDLGVPRSAPR